MLLRGKELSNMIKSTLKSQVSDFFKEKKRYVAILFFWENGSSKTYVHLKKKYGEEIWIPTIVFGQEDKSSHFSPQLDPRIKKTYNNTDEVLTLIDILNQDPHCIGIMIQLPLPDYFSKDKLKLLQAINESKDIDGMWGSLVGKSFFEMIEFIPATPRAVFTLLDHYELGDLKGKEVVIIWQSTIVGKPLALECLKRGAKIQCFDLKNSPEEIEQWCQVAEYIFSATGCIHLINEKHINNQGNQIFVDIWYGHLNGNPVGDIDFEAVKEKVMHITPVPWGIWPLTIASLFQNSLNLAKQFWFFSD